VVVHADGTFAGTVTASQVLVRIEERGALVRRETIAARDPGSE